MAINMGETQSLNAIAPHITPFRYVKICSGTITTPVNQTGAPTLRFIFQR